MILLDTTILVYAVGSEHDLRAPCRAVIDLAREQEARVSTTVEAIQEFAHVRAKRRGRADAADLARDYAIGLAPLLRPEGEDLLLGLEWFRSTTELGAFDAVLAGAALRHGLPLASADGSFAEVTGLRVLDPRSPSFLEEARELARDS